MNFDAAFEILLGHEGGYSNNPADPGGETNFGISKRAYPNEDIKGMALERAREIYHRDYWVLAGCESVPGPIKFQLFDMAVNSGVKQAIKTLQTAVFAGSDGVLGPQTLMAINSMPTPRLVARFNGLRLTLMAALPTWPAFGRGWARRIADNLLEA
jgi:lysozyme family protein